MQLTPVTSVKRSWLAWMVLLAFITYRVAGLLEIR